MRLDLNKDVLGLQIAMRDPAVVEVAKSLDQLSHDTHHVCLADIVLAKVGIQLATMHVLHDDPHVLWVLVVLADFHHVWVAQLTHNLDFVAEEKSLFRSQLLLVNLFESVGFVVV